MRRSTLLLALAMVLAVAGPAFATLDEDKFFFSHKFDLHKKLFKIPTGSTGPMHSFFHHHTGRKMLVADGKDKADSFHKEHLDKLKKLIPTGTWKFHSDSETPEEIKADSLFHRKLETLKKLLPTGAWEWDASHEDAEGQFFLPKHKLDKLKKLLPTGHWKWDPEMETLSTADEKKLLLNKFGKKIVPTGTHTGPGWKH